MSHTQSPETPTPANDGPAAPKPIHVYPDQATAELYAQACLDELQAVMSRYSGVTALLAVAARFRDEDGETDDMRIMANMAPGQVMDALTAVQKAPDIQAEIRRQLAGQLFPGAPA